MLAFYIAYMVSLGIFAILASLFGIRKKVKPFLYAMILWGLLLWPMYFLILSPRWVLANGDLMYMYKVYERTINSSQYLFNDPNVFCTLLQRYSKVERFQPGIKGLRNVY